MKINLKCFADLAERHDCDYREATEINASEGATVANVIRDNGIAERDVKIIFVNGVLASNDRRLGDGDRVTLVPSTGGM
ncbi:MAG: MoaD/ThiS family protein [Desulfobacteraceae bacterium]|nr:MoaD/ThiS family protein [Desulfobacteraceae bacterium]